MPPSRYLITGLTCALLVGLTACGHHDDPPPPPVAFDQSFGMFENDSISTSLDAQDVDYATSSFIVDAAPLHGVLEINPNNGDFTYTPDLGFIGRDNFLWDVEDRFGGSNVAQVDIDVQPRFASQASHVGVPGEPLLALAR